MRRVTLWGLRGVRVGEASHPGPRHYSRGTHRSRSRSVGRSVGGLEGSRPLSRRPEGSVPPTPSVLAVTVQPIEVIQDAGSSDGEPLVRPNNGRDVVSRIGDPNIYGRFSILSDDTRVPETLLDALEEDLERPRLLLEDSGSQWDPSEDDLPLSSVGRTSRRFPQATQRDSGAEFTLTRESGLTPTDVPRSVDPRQSEGFDGVHGFVSVSDVDY